MENFFEYKDCFTPLKSVESIPIFVNSLQGCKYTIAIPTYNRPHDLKQALDSAIGQNFQGGYNIIVVDNNPERNDETEILMMAYRNEDNISYYKNSCNVGMMDNWNKLFLLSETEYVVMLHDDDVLFSNFLSEMDRVAAMTPKFVTINAEKLSWDGNKIPNVKKKLSGKSLRVYKYSKYSNFVFFHFGAPSGCLFNKKNVLELGGFDNAAYPSSDYVFIQKLCMSKGMVLKSKTPLMLYRVTQNTTSKIETQLAWLNIEYRIKEELAEILHIPSCIKDLIEYFEIKLRLRGIAKDIPNYSYMKWSPGGNLFLVFFKVYRYILKTYIELFCSINLGTKTKLY